MLNGQGRRLDLSHDLERIPSHACASVSPDNWDRRAREHKGVCENSTGSFMKKYVRRFLAQSEGLTRQELPVLCLLLGRCRRWHSAERKAGVSPPGVSRSASLQERHGPQPTGDSVHGRADSRARKLPPQALLRAGPCPRPYPSCVSSRRAPAGAATAASRSRSSACGSVTRARDSNAGLGAARPQSPGARPLAAVRVDVPWRGEGQAAWAGLTVAQLPSRETGRCLNPKSQETVRKNKGGQPAFPKKSGHQEKPLKMKTRTKFSQ